MDTGLSGEQDNTATMKMVKDLVAGDRVKAGDKVAVITSVAPARWVRTNTGHAYDVQFTIDGVADYCLEDLNSEIEVLP